MTLSILPTLARFDGWENEVTGFGTTRDKTQYGNFFRSLSITDNMVDALYVESDLAATAVDCVPEEMLRRGYKLCVALKQETPEPGSSTPALNKPPLPSKPEGGPPQPKSGNVDPKPGEGRTLDEPKDQEAGQSESPVTTPKGAPKPADAPAKEGASEAPELSEPAPEAELDPEEPEDKPAIEGLADDYEDEPPPMPMAPKQESQDEQLAKDITKALTDLNAHDKFTEADCWGRLYGGAVIAMGVEDGRPASMPLIPEKARKLDWLVVIDKRYVTPFSFYKEGPKAGEPETFLVHKKGGQGADIPGQISETFLVHETRLLMFRGVRTTYTERQSRNYWDHSILTRAFRIIRSFDTAFMAVETLLTDGSQAVFKMKGLLNYIGAKGQKALEERMKVVDMMRSVMRAMVIDENEEFERHNYTYAGLSDVLDKLMLRLAAAFRIPVTILMGQSPAGMNATGDSDFRWFYNRIETRQVQYYEPLLRRLIEIMCACKEGPTKGKVPEKIEFEWHSLWAPTDKEKADTDKVKADTAVALVGADICTPEEVALSGYLPEGLELDIEMRQQAQAATKEAASMDPEALRAHAPVPPMIPGQEPQEPSDDADNPPNLQSGPPPGPSKAAPGTKNKPGKKKNPFQA